MKHSEKLTRSEAAEALGISGKTLAQWEKQGKIPAPERDYRGWRLYDRQAVLDFRKRLLGGDEEAQPSLRIEAMEISARNRFTGVVKAISGGGVMAEVVLELEGGQELVSVITRSSVRRLGLRVGDRAVAIVKSTDVLIAR